MVKGKTIYKPGFGTQYFTTLWELLDTFAGVEESSWEVKHEIFEKVKHSIEAIIKEADL